MTEAETSLFPGEAPASFGSHSLRYLSFVLPQFHPIPENDSWWGPGFTDWFNVATARPLFRTHAQPHLPADLGFYDLRLPDTRQGQADLAQAHGITGFCWYHYWFHGRRLLERPFDEVLRTGAPELPFCLCWANENWTRVWSGKESKVLVRQEYSAEDDLAHIRWLAEAFADHRQVRIEGRPLFLVYRATDLPDARRTAERWRTEAVRLGVGDPYLCTVESVAPHVHPAELGFDAAVQFAPDFSLWPRRRSALVRAARRAVGSRSLHRQHRIIGYDELVHRMLSAPEPGYRRFPCVTPGFDNTPRRTTGATIVVGSSPGGYEQWLREVTGRFTPYSPEENLVFVNAWNEWAEGNHLEPCQRWGRAYLEAHARAAVVGQS